MSVLERGEYQDREEALTLEGQNIFEDLEEMLHKAILGGYDRVMKKAAEETVKQIAGIENLRFGDLEAIQVEYQRMRLRWIEGIRLSRAGMKREICRRLPDSCFQLPFDTDGLFSIQQMEENLYRDLQNLALYFRDSMGAGENDGAIFQQIEQYLLLHYNEKITIGFIAEHFAISESYLSRAFKKNIGMGIPDYLNDLRIQKARELLLSPQMKVADIAFSLGYQDEKYFSRVFHKLEGISPQQYRQKNSR